MKLNLKLYEKTGPSRSMEPSVSFVAKGMRFNVATVERYLKGKKAAELLWDEKNQVLGFRFISKETDNSFPIRTYRQSKSPLATISCTRFLIDNKIHDILKNKKTFRLEEYEDVVIANLGGGAP